MGDTSQHRALVLRKAEPLSPFPALPSRPISATFPTHLGTFSVHSFEDNKVSLLDLGKTLFLIGYSLKDRTAGS